MMRGFCPSGLCPDGIMYGGGFVQGGFVQGGFVQGGFAPDSLQRALLHCQIKLTGILFDELYCCNSPIVDI